MARNQIHLTISEVDKAAIIAAAKLAGLTAASWIRTRLMEIARRELRKAETEKAA